MAEECMTCNGARWLSPSGRPSSANILDAHPCRTCINVVSGAGPTPEQAAQTERLEAARKTLHKWGPHPMDGSIRHFAAALTELEAAAREEQTVELEALKKVVWRAKWTMAAAAAWFYKNTADDETDLQDDLLAFARWIHNGMNGEIPPYTPTGRAFFDEMEEEDDD